MSKGDRYALRCLGWILIQFYLALWALIKGAFIGLMVVGMGLLAAGWIVTAIFDVPSEFGRSFSVAAAGAGAGGAVILFAYDCLGDYVCGGRIKGAVIGSLGGLVGGLALYAWEPWTSAFAYCISGLAFAAVGGSMSGWLLGIHPGSNPFPPPWRTGETTLSDAVLEQIDSESGLPQGIRWNRAVQEGYVRFLLDRVHPRSSGEYKDMFWHQAPDIGRKRFIEEVFDYNAAPGVEAEGIRKGKNLAFFVARSSRYNSPAALKEGVAAAIRTHLEKLDSARLSPEHEGSFMYRDGLKKVLAQFERASL